MSEWEGESHDAHQKSLVSMSTDKNNSVQPYALK